MLIKQFEENDAVDVLETYLVSWISTYHDKFPPQVYERLISRITLDYVKHFKGKKRFCFVVREHRKVLGFIYCKVDKMHGWIEHSYVRPENKRKGLGTQLLERALTELRHRNCFKARAVVLGSNHEALAFYKKHAFQVVKRALNRENGNVLDIVVEKNLQATR